MPGSTFGEVGSVTLAGPPEMMMPRAPDKSEAGRLMSATTAWTPSSRMRRAIRWQYWPPAFRTTIWFTKSPRAPVATAPARPLPRAPQLLCLLEDLALGLDRRRDDDLGLLQLADAEGAHRAHAGADRTHQVQRAVLGEGRTEQDLLERSRDAHADTGA